METCGAWVWLLFLPVVWWAGAITACAIKPDTNLLQILQVLTEKLDQPFSISYTPYTLRCVFTFTIAYVLGIGIYYSQKKNYRRGVEHGSAQVKEDDEEYQSPLDILFERLEMRNPESIAVKQYAIYKQAAGKTAKSILISVGVRLAAFNLKQIADLTCTDELDLYSIGEKKVALFCCIPDADTSLNYLVGMIYSNLFQTLYYVAAPEIPWKTSYPGTLHYG